MRPTSGKKKQDGTMKTIITTLRIGFVFVFGLLTASQAQAEPLVFSEVVEPPGTPPPMVGSEYRFVNVIPGVDAVLRVDGLFNSATFMDTDGNGIFAGGLITPPR